nr:SH3 domain-containing protein [uncultured Staphylococcus sp.]
MHAGLDPLKQAITEAAQNKTKDYFIRNIQAYMDGKQPLSTVVADKPGSGSTPANKADIDGYKTNKYGTLYKAEHAAFTPNTAIITREVGPFTICPQSGILQPGQTIYYDEVMKQDGHVWVSYTAYDGAEVFLPVREWDKSTDTVGPLWGTIS